MRTAQQIYDYLNLFPNLSRRFVTHTWVRGSDSIDDYGRWYDAVNKEADQRLLEHKVRWYYRHRSRSLRLCTLVFPFAPSREQLVAGTRPHLHTLIIDSVSPSEEQERYRSALLDHALNNDEKRIEPNFLANKLRGSQERKEGTLGQISVLLMTLISMLFGIVQIFMINLIPTRLGAVVNGSLTLSTISNQPNYWTAKID